MTLAGVATPDLRKLRELVASGVLACPLTETGLRAHGMPPLAGVALRFADRDAMLAALDLVLDERERAARPPIELVWTGPQSSAPQTRDTAVVLAELFNRAQHRVLLAGYMFTQGERFLRPLHAALVRGVAARLFLHIQGHAAGIDAIESYASRRVAEFVTDNWRFGEPYPEFFYDPRTAMPGAQTILHAKCAVVDGQAALVTSANFTFSGQTQNIEVGALLEDEAFSRRLEGQFNALVSQGALVEAKWR